MLPRVLYTVDIWCTPLDSKRDGPITIRSVGVINQIASVQRAGALAITGSLQTSPTDALDACTFLLSVHMVIAKWCQRAYIRMASLLPEHPLYKPVN